MLGDADGSFSFSGMLADLDSEFTAVGDLTIEGNNVKFGVTAFLGPDADGNAIVELSFRLP